MVGLILRREGPCPVSHLPSCEHSVCYRPQRKGDCMNSAGRLPSGLPRPAAHAPAGPVHMSMVRWGPQELRDPCPGSWALLPAWGRMGS